MNFDVATVKRSILRQEKKSDFERMYVEHTPIETAQTIYGYFGKK